MAEGNGLLNRRRDKISTEGSNPSLSATQADELFLCVGSSVISFSTSPFITPSCFKKHAECCRFRVPGFACLDHLSQQSDT